MNRRSLIGGLLATLAAPAIIRTPGLLMPVRVVRPTMMTLADWVMVTREMDMNEAMDYWPTQHSIKTIEPDGTVVITNLANA